MDEPQPPMTAAQYERVLTQLLEMKETLERIYILWPTDELRLAIGHAVNCLYWYEYEHKKAGEF